MGLLCPREGGCVARARTFEIDFDLLARRAAPGGSRPRTSEKRGGGGAAASASRRRHRRRPSISLLQATGTFTVRGISGSGVCRKAIGRWACRASGCPVPAAERLTASATPRKRRSQNCATSVLARRLQLRPHALGQHSQLRPSGEKWVALLLLLFEQFLVVVRSPAQKVDV